MRQFHTQRYCVLILQRTALPCILQGMKRLKERVTQFEKEVGRIEARTRLCRAIERSERTLLSWLQNGVPSANEAVSLALACGCNEGEAWDLARDCFPLKAKGAA
jgi:hypothetical protein